MPLLASFMVPHPPLIIPEIGRGGEEQIQETTASYVQVAKEIAGLRPDTIIISSPHAPYYGDYFYLASESTVEGNLSNFGAGNISFSEEIDLELVSKIKELAKEKEFPTGDLAPTDKLDHGTMVPLYFIRKFYPTSKIVVVGLSNLPLIKNYQMGMLMKEAVDSLNKNVVFVASGDLSHKLQEYGPYGFVEEGPIYDKRLIEDCKSTLFGNLLNYKESFLEKVAQCGHRSFLIMAGLLDRIEVRSKFYSYQDVTGVGYGILSFYPTNVDESRNFYDIYLKEHIIKNYSDPLVDLAKKTIEAYVLYGRTYKPEKVDSELLNNRAGVFVSIHKFDQLRGCIGTFMPTYDSIADEIIHNAISACSKDPRFSPITEDELDYLDINVDVLSEPEPCALEDLDPKRYGVIVTSGYKRGLLLPDLEGIDDVDTQISIAKRKGNISNDEVFELQRFEVIRHK